MSEKEIKLHLGCGGKHIPGYINIDIQPDPAVDLVSDIRILPFEDGSVDFIYSCTNIEHFGRREWRDLLKHWFNKLKPGATLRITTADFRSVCERYLEKGNVEELLGCIVGGQKDDYDWHGMVFDFELLKNGLEDAGFANVRRYDWRTTDVAKLGIDDFSQAYLPRMDKEHGRLMSLNMEADKPSKQTNE